MGKTLRITYALLSPSLRRRAGVVLSLMIATACFEVLGVGSILPFLTVAMDPTAVQRNAVMNWAYESSGVTLSDFILLIGVAILVLIVMMNGVAALALWTQKRFIYSFANALSTRLMERYLLWPYEAFLTRNTSELSKNVLNETYEVLSGILKPGTALLARGFVVISLVVLLIVLQPLITLLTMAVFGGAYVIVYSVIKHRLGRLGRKRVDVNTLRYKLNAEAFGGLKEVKALGREEFFVRRYAAVSTKYASYQATSKIYSQLPRFLIETLAFGGLMAGFVVLMATGYDMTDVVPLMGLFAFAATRLLPGFQEILAALASFRFNEHLLGKLHEDLVQDGGRSRTPPTGEERTLVFECRVRLDHVRFRYPGSEKDVIRDLTLEIPKNSSVALVGTTGSGKTTIADITLGLLEPQQGSLVVDDMQVTANNVAAWRGKVGYVQQDVFLSDDTIARNIAFGIDDRVIDPAAVERAAAMAHIHEFIVNELPNGYGTVIGERGVRLSGGQRQRLGIARALYLDPELLVLDEATSDIDNITEECITEAIQSLARKKTLIVVAHRLATIRRCDRICVLDAGEIVASGTFDELAVDNRLFQRMIHGMRLESVDAIGKPVTVPRS